MATSKKKKAQPKAVRPSGKADDNFFTLVYEVARQIPKGRVTSYGAIAKEPPMVPLQKHSAAVCRPAWSAGP